MTTLQPRNVTKHKTRLNDNSFNQPRTIIAFTGFAQSGKDTAAKYLIDKYNFHKIAFAEPLRRGLYALNPLIPVTPIMIHRLNLKLLYTDKESIRDVNYGIITRLQRIIDLIGWDSAKKIPEIRNLLQLYGTEAGRGIHGSDCWIQVAYESMQGLDRIVITDCRFENEVEAIRKWGGKVIRIFRDGISSVNNHISDKGLSDEFVDMTIYNNSAPEDLWLELENKLNNKLQAGK